MVPRMYDLAFFLAHFRGPLGVHTAGDVQQTSIFAYARLNPVCSIAHVIRCWYLVRMIKVLWAAGL